MTQLAERLANQDVDVPVVWVVTISHRDGVDIEIFDCEDCAKICLLRYVQERWEATESPDPVPDDREDAINAYFHHREDHERACVMETRFHTHEEAA
jgi:hypothetical protein